MSESDQDRVPWDPGSLRRSASARKFFDAAVEQGWKIEADARVVHGLLGAQSRLVEGFIALSLPEGTDLDATQEPIVRYVAIFDPTSGAYYNCTRWCLRGRVGQQEREVKLYNRRGVAPKLGDLLEGVSHGPKWQADRAIQEAQRAAEAEEAQRVRREALGAAAQIDVVRDVVDATRRDRDEAASLLRRSLEGVIANAQEHLRSLDQGIPPRPLGSLLGQSAREAEVEAIKLQVLFEKCSRLETLFGKGDHSWNTRRWKDFREIAAEEAAEEAAKEAADA